MILKTPSSVTISTTVDRSDGVSSTVVKSVTVNKAPGVVTTGSLDQCVREIVIRFKSDCDTVCESTVTEANDMCVGMAL